MKKDTFRIRPDDVLAMDATSKREFDDNGYMHVADSNLTREQVAPYFGYEIPGSKKLGLEPERIYYGYRPAEELQKGLATFNGVPLLFVHKMDSADAPLKQERVGTIGTNAEITYPFLKNSLVIWDKRAIDSVLDGSLKDLSCGYRYKADFRPGKTKDGIDYDFVMTDIRCNHVALVAEGRAPDCYVEDSLPDPLKGQKMEDTKKVEGCDAADGLKEVVAKYVEDPEKQAGLIAELLALQPKEPTAEPEPKADDQKADEGAKDADPKPDGDGKKEDEPKQEPVAPDEPKAEPVKDEPKEPEPKPGADEPKDDGAMDANAIAEAVKAKVVSLFRAADAVKPVLGQVDAMAFDSADAIFLEACRQMGVSSVSEASAKDVFLAVSAFKAKTAEGTAMDAKPSERANPALKLLNR